MTSFLQDCLKNYTHTYTYIYVQESLCGVCQWNSQHTHNIYQLSLPSYMGVVHRTPKQS